MKGFARLALAAASLTYLLLVIGAVVRLTGSGLGCPDWPLCHGQLVAPAYMGPLIEYTHRVTAALVGLLVLLLAGWVLVRYRREKLLVGTTLAALFGVGLAGYLGRVVVNHELPGLLVLIHLLVAFVTLALLVLVATWSARWGRNSRAANGSKGFGVLVLLTTLSVLILVASGAYVTSGGPHAGSGVPRALESVGIYTFSVSLHVGAMLVTALFLGSIVVRAYRGHGSDGAVKRTATVLPVLFAAQVAVGITQLAQGLPAVLVGIHVALAGAIWAALIILVGLTRQPAAVSVSATSPAMGSRSKAPLSRA